MDVENAIIGNLAGRSLYKISKRSPNIKHLCVETHYIEYKPNTLVQDSGDHWLSFVPAQNIIQCITYGDQLTEPVFNPNDLRFRQIACEPFYRTNPVFDEHGYRRFRHVLGRTSNDSIHNPYDSSRKT